jgi:hypothetical protein
VTDEPQQPTAPVTPPTPPLFSEAPYSGNVRARIRGYDWQLTIRAADSTTFTAKVDGLMNWLDTKADKAVNLELPPNVPAPVTGAPAPQAHTQSSNGGTFHIVKMQIEPRADGKVNIKFFEVGHQYPDITAVKTPAEGAVLLQPLGGYTPAHMVAGEYNITAAIEWVASYKMNSKGNPYKNIKSIKPA